MLVLQQIPRAVMVEPPSEVTIPPHVALVAKMLLTAFVVTTG